jgi:predicted Zn-dependent protease
MNKREYVEINKTKIPSQEDINLIKKHAENMANYSMKGVHHTDKTKILMEIDKCIYWLSYHDNEQRQENYFHQEDLRLLIVRNFIGI